MACIQPGYESEDDDEERVSEYVEKEENSGCRRILIIHNERHIGELIITCTRIPLCHTQTHPSHEVKKNQARNAEGCIEFGIWQMLQRVDDHFVGCSARAIDDVRLSKDALIR